MKRSSVLFLISLVAFITAPVLLLDGAAASFSALWGENGEQWDPRGRLPDFSYAGYHRGERPLPSSANAPGIDVRDLGAIGDGVHDDTEAFLKAIDLADGVIEIPAGRYRITDILEIRRGGLVIRGAGADQTTLYFPVPLNDIRPNWGATTSGQRTSNYSWSGGFLWVRGNLGGKVIATVTGEAQRGDRSLQLSSTEGIAPGREVEIHQRDDDADSLAAHLYSDDPGDTAKLNSRTSSSIVVTVTKIDGNTIHFDRPLRFDVRLHWQPEVRSFTPTVTEVGIEGLTFEFPNIPYEGHFTELGNNALALSGTAHCWIRDVRIVNPDSGLFVTGSFNTATGVVMESSRRQDKARRSTGHHGIYFGGGDNLFTDFDFRMKFIHDLSLSHCAGNVISAGKGIDLSFDHHKRAPYENLYTDIDTGKGEEVWRCGGGSALGKNCGARGTFWNIRARNPIPAPPKSFGPASMNLVGIFTDEPAVTEMDGRWFELFAPGELQPPNLHQAQLARRLAEPADSEPRIALRSRTGYLPIPMPAR